MKMNKDGEVKFYVMSTRQQCLLPCDEVRENSYIECRGLGGGGLVVSRYASAVP